MRRRYVWVWDSELGRGELVEKVPEEIVVLPPPGIWPPNYFRLPGSGPLTLWNGDTVRWTEEWHLPG